MSMTHHIAIGDAPVDFVRPLDFETQTLLRCFLTPILETASDWAEMHQRLLDKGYAYEIIEGRMILRNRESGAAVCTAGALGVPFAQLSARLGLPQ